MFWDSIHPPRGRKILSRPARWRMKCHTFWCHLLFSSIPMFFSHFLAFQCFLSNIPCHVQFLPEYISLVSAGPQLLSQINPDSHGSLGWATSEGGAYKYSWVVTQIQIQKWRGNICRVSGTMLISLRLRILKSIVHSCTQDRETWRQHTLIKIHKYVFS